MVRCFIFVVVEFTEMVEMEEEEERGVRVCEGNEVAVDEFELK